MGQIYRYVNENKDIIYVGQVEDDSKEALQRRIQQHKYLFKDYTGQFEKLLIPDKYLPLTKSSTIVLETHFINKFNSVNLINCNHQISYGIVQFIPEDIDNAPWEPLTINKINKKDSQKTEKSYKYGKKFNYIQKDIKKKEQIVLENKLVEDFYNWILSKIDNGEYKVLKDKFKARKYYQISISNTKYYDLCSDNKNLTVKCIDYGKWCYSCLPFNFSYSLINHDEYEKFILIPHDYRNNFAVKDFLECIKKAKDYYIEALQIYKIALDEYYEMNKETATS